MKNVFIMLLNVFVVCLLITSSVRAEDVKGFLSTGRNAWAAFECSYIAGFAGEDSEKARLFKIGYSSGENFLKAIRGLEIKPADISDEVSFNLLTLSDINAGFSLGQLYERAISNFFPYQKESLNDMKSRAKIEFTKKNCSLIK